jgi:hypothetical protein
MAFSLRSLFHE